MKCKELMINDWVSDKYGYLMQITVIGDGYVSFEDDEGNLCQLDDKCNQPEPIPLTYEILKKNGFKEAALKEPNTTNLVSKWWSKQGEIYIKEYYLARSREITYVVEGGHRMRIENIYMVHQL